MATTLAIKEGGGGSLSSTVLWTNGSPSSSFSGQTVTVSDAITNYKYIRVVFKTTTSSSIYGEVITPSDVLVTYTGNGNPRLILGFRNGSGTYYTREAATMDSTSFYFGNTSSNSNLIPTEIYGIN